MPNPIYRIIDANINRAGEGLRVLEDVVRFWLNNASLAEQLKSCRHRVVRTVDSLGMSLLSSRDVAGDIGFPEASANTTQGSIIETVRANSKRIEESMRILEEICKIPETAIVADHLIYQEIRYAVYEIEKEIVEALQKRAMNDRIKGLYVIADTASMGGRDEIEVVSAAIAGGASLIQLRDKSRTRAQLLPLARQIRNVCKENKVVFILNDYPDIAVLSEADGVHIGIEDLPIIEVRKLLGWDKIIGYSAPEIESAIKAEKEGADYIAAGSVFPSPTKPGRDVIGPERLEALKKVVNIPVVAIGGINSGNIHKVVNTGIAAVAVITAVLGENDVQAATRILVKKMAKL